MVDEKTNKPSEHGPSEQAPEEKEKAPSEAEVQASNRKRRTIIFRVILGILVLGIIAGIYWFIFIRGYQYTDDAYVNGYSTQLTSLIPGTIVSLYVDETDLVEEGQLLLQIDPTDYKIAFDQSQTNLALAVRQVLTLQQNVSEAKANYVLLKANVAKAQFDYNIRQTLTKANTKAISKEDVEHSKIDLDVANASLNQGLHQLIAAIAAVGNTSLEDHPTVVHAKEDVRNAYINLKRCDVLSPIRGYIAQRSAYVGQWTKQGANLLAIIPLTALWIDANFKEVQLGDMRVGQPAKVTVDMYGSSVVYDGKVAGIGSGTGSVFSILPPQNATGNWIKIVQRVPVRIELPPEQVRKKPLLLGLSADVDVDVKDPSGLFLHTVPSESPIARTSTYDIPMASVEALIVQIIKTNVEFKDGS